MAQSFVDKTCSIPIHQIARCLKMKFSKDFSCAGPCPCGNEVRGKNDHRLPVGLYSDREIWRCHHCYQKGDGLNLVSFTLEGAKYKDLSSERQSRVREWYDQQGFTDGVGGRGCGAGRIQAHRAWNPPTPRRHVVPEVQERKYVPQKELIEVWKSCVPVDEDEEAVRMLESWGASPGAVAFYELARVLPRDAKTYPWMVARGKPWTMGWRLLVPARDVHAKPRGFKARWIGSGDPPNQLKSASPKGYKVKEIVNADTGGYIILERGQLPLNIRADQAYDIRIVEGEKDFISSAGRPHVPGENMHATFGIWQGGWSDAFAQRIPRQSNITIIIATDPDEQGEKYAKNIRLSLLKQGFDREQIKRRIAGDLR